MYLSNKAVPNLIDNKFCTLISCNLYQNQFSIRNIIFPILLRVSDFSSVLLIKRTGFNSVIKDYWFTNFNQLQSC